MKCRNCGEREVEVERECYATPVCLTCLPPPKPLPVRYMRKSDSCWPHEFNSRGVCKICGADWRPDAPGEGGR